MYIFSYLKYVAWCNKNYVSIGNWAKGCEGNPIENEMVYNSDDQKYYVIFGSSLGVWCDKE